MKKIIILAYYFPPCNFVGAKRIKAMANYFHENGIYPIIITRNWNLGQTDIIDYVIDNHYTLEHHDTYELHYLPYKQNLRDRLARAKVLNLLQKFLTLCELIFSNYFISALPYSNFYKHAHSLLKKNNDLKTIVASGRPFQLFSIGYKLKKEFKDIKWIPDYRDEWTTRKTRVKDGILNKFIFNLELKSEQKWTSNASFFTTVSDEWKNNISSLINKRGFVVKNGYESILDFQKNKQKKLSIAYLGTLYPYQEINPIIDTIIEIHTKHKYEIEMKFIGISTIPEMETKIITKIKNYGHLFKIIPSVSGDQLHEELKNIDIGYLTAYNNLSGCIPVKLYDYISYKIPMVLYPSDNDVMESLIEKANLGYVINNKNELYNILTSLILTKNTTKAIPYKPKKDQLQEYSRQFQAKIFCEHIKS